SGEVDLALSRSRTVSGTLVAPTGGPAAGVRVRVVRLGPAAQEPVQGADAARVPDGWPADGTSGPDGRFALAGLPAEDVWRAGRRAPLPGRQRRGPPRGRRTRAGRRCLRPVPRRAGGPGRPRGARGRAWGGACPPACGRRPPPATGGPPPRRSGRPTPRRWSW